MKRKPITDSDRLDALESLVLHQARPNWRVECNSVAVWIDSVNGKNNPPHTLREAIDDFIRRRESK